ncbi:CYTH and CHAD domain-containing protein [Paracoccus binzhouensis]|uniref:CYTH and CHAD domain-containing protein n=1 Tax=Paracoccus binzhouensis TaxID=2796149 RepID=UPI0018EF2816|nr:CHAD domain-containing protein [Paracoccus binzhouensis]
MTDRTEEDRDGKAAIPGLPRAGDPCAPGCPITTEALQLDLGPDAAAVLAGSELLPGVPQPIARRTTYFDSSGGDLAAAGFTLRIREQGGDRQQILQAPGAPPGLFALPEWRREVAGDRPVLDDSMPVPALLGIRAQDLGPIFALATQRRLWTLAWEGATIRLVLDQGDVTADGRRAALCSLGLELLDGPPATLFSLARRLDAIAPLRLGLLDEAGRGFLLRGPLRRMHKAAPVALTRDMTAGDSFRRIAAACLLQFRLNEPLIDRANPEAVHQARVALRRLRSALSIFRPMLRDETAGRLAEECRWLAATLGEARDLDVLRARDEAVALLARIEPAREAAYGRAQAALASRRARLLMIDLAEYLAIGPWLALPAAAESRDMAAREFAAAALDRLRRKVRKGGADLAELPDPARHEVRKDAKKLRYAAEFFAPLFPEKRRRRRAARFLDALEALQDRMGALNDLATAPALITRLGLQDDPATAVLAGHADKRVLIEAAAEAHDAFADAKRFWR